MLAFLKVSLWRSKLSSLRVSQRLVKNPSAYGPPVYIRQHLIGRVEPPQKKTYPSPEGIIPTLPQIYALFAPLLDIFLPDNTTQDRHTPF